MVYLANLCHDCRSCFDACPYAPPHELAVDIPLLMSTVRERTYAHYASPRWIAERVDRRLSFALAFSGFAVVGVVGATSLANGLEAMFTPRTGPGAFYEVVPWLAMMLPFSALTISSIAVLLLAGARFWRDSGGTRAEFLTDLRNVPAAIWDVATLRNLRGGGPGCTYPEERPNQRRRLWHSLVFYGFISAFVSTTSAAVYQDILGILPPYGLLSLPVLFGTVGGLAMIAGCIGLLAQKSVADPARIAKPMRVMDIAFILSLLLVNFSGMLLLVLRETSAMGILLASHLGFIAALFLSLPYGKFAHSMYRFLALLRDRVEIRGEQ